LNLVGSDRRIEIEKGFDIPAHSLLPHVSEFHDGVKDDAPPPTLS
jgi:hypothetical protein